MRKRNPTYIIAIFMLLNTFDLHAQKSEMEPNKNQIDRDFIVSTELQARINSQHFIENEIHLVLEKTKDSLYSIYLINKTTDSLSISNQDGQLFLIQEAKNKNGVWKPVEYWQYSTCGNSYQSEKIASNGILKTESLAYFGDFETEIRFKALINDHIYFSNPIIGYVNLSQFAIPIHITKDKNLEIIEKVGGSNLLHQILFLEPNGLKAFEAQWKSYLIKMTELRNMN